MSKESEKAQRHATREREDRDARNAEYQAWCRADWDEKYDINPRQAFLDLVRRLEDFENDER